MGSRGELQLNAPLPAISARGPLERAALVTLVGALGAGLLFSPVKLCLVALALRIPCPGCGMTRATLALLQGDFAHAFGLHPLSPLVVPLATGLIAAQTLGYVQTGRAFTFTRGRRSIELVAASLALLLMGVWVARFFGYFGGPVALR